MKCKCSGYIDGKRYEKEGTGFCYLVSKRCNVTYLNPGERD